MTPPSHVRDGDPAVETQRRDVDLARTEERAKSDNARTDQRELEDRARHLGDRADGNTTQVVGIQRAADDDSLRLERKNADVARSQEHALSDVTLAREKDARREAEKETGRTGDREARRTSELEEALRLIDTQLALVAENLAAMLEGVPQGNFDGVLTGRVATVRAATGRIQTLLRNVIDPKTAPQRADAPGGSG
jgi:hypothetical protein